MNGVKVSSEPNKALKEESSEPDTPRKLEWAISIIFSLAGIFLILASYEVIPLNIEAIYGKVIGFGLLGIGALSAIVTLCLIQKESIERSNREWRNEAEQGRKKEQFDNIQAYRNYLYRFYQALELNPKAKKIFFEKYAIQIPVWEKRYNTEVTVDTDFLVLQQLAKDLEAIVHEIEKLIQPQITKQDLINIALGRA